MKSKYSTILFILGLIGLIIFQREAVMPLVYKAASSDLFLVDSNDEKSMSPIENDMTTIAFINCNKYIKDELGDDFSVIFIDKPINAWSIGNYEYVINAELELGTPESANLLKRYVCRIKYTEGDDLSGINDPDNWSIDGVSGIDEI